MLLAVLVLCMPSYGYILVYKMTMSGTKAMWETTDDTEGWLLQKASGVGYLVLDVDEDDPSVLYNVQYVDYRTETWEDHTKHKVYEMWTTGVEFTQSILPGLPPKKDIASINVDLSTESGTTSGGKLLGTVKSTDIGTGEKKDVATSLKGACAWESYEDDTLNESGYGTLSLTLDSKWTKTANNPDEEKGFYGDFWSFLDSESGPSEDEPKAPQGLIYWLESKGYESAGEYEE